MQPGMSRSHKSQHSTVRRRELQCQNPNNFNGVVIGVMRSGNIEPGKSERLTSSRSLERRWSWWGRVISYVSYVDALYERALAAACQPTTAPRDAEWGERFFHLIDPDGHELSFARPLLPI
jgi:hypothetical protein